MGVGMTYGKQVDSSHYGFSSYMTKGRWASIWHQLHEVHKLAPRTVLEVGPGPGIFKAVALAFGIYVDTLDIDPDLKPDYVGSATAMPFPDGTYDAVCAFQMLEHFPYEVSLQAFRELVRVSRRNIIISLPDARIAWRFLAHVPLLGPRSFLINRPRLMAPVHEFDGEHYWEINKRGYPLSRVITDFSKEAELLLTYRVSENPYHRFFVFQH